MAIMDILLPFVSEPSGAAIAVIDKCMAMAGDLGARVTATAVEEDILVRPFRPVRSRWLGRVLEKGLLGRTLFRFTRRNSKVIHQPSGRFGSDAVANAGDQWDRGSLLSFIPTPRPSKKHQFVLKSAAEARSLRGKPCLGP
jgi:hypothetical protein